MSVWSLLDQRKLLWSDSGRMPWLVAVLRWLDLRANVSMNLIACIWLSGSSRGLAIVWWIYQKCKRFCGVGFVQEFFFIGIICAILSALWSGPWVYGLVWVLGRLCFASKGSFMGATLLIGGYGRGPPELVKPYDRSFFNLIF